MDHFNHPESRQLDRRQMLASSGTGFGLLALSGLLAGDQQSIRAAESGAIRSTAHHSPRATSVIFLFMEGGPSHIDLFDPKPKLNELAGKPLPDSFQPVITPMGEYDAPLLASRRRWQQHGECGTWVSDWLPHTATCVDEIAVLRGCWANGLNHSNGVCQMNTGSIIGGRPSLGAWVNYGLGSENENMPAFVVMEDNPGKVINGPRNWSAGFMPGSYQGTPLLNSDPPIRDLQPAIEVPSQRLARQRELLARLNRRHAALRDNDSRLEARIESYELAFRMQLAAPEAVNFASETAETQNLYGMDQDATRVFGRNCLLARRLVERGVHFVQLYHGSGSKWDAHSGIESNHATNCAASDKPVAGLLKDLKRRGLLDQTLVVWGGEFGRTPMSEKGTGRDHNPYGFTIWMAGGGVAGGQVIGNTDEIGLHAIEDRLHVHDLHASILYMLGIDHSQLVYLHQGRPERATINEGQPCLKLLGS